MNAWHNRRTDGCEICMYQTRWLVQGSSHIVSALPDSLSGRLGSSGRLGAYIYLTQDDSRYAARIITRGV